MNPYNYGYTNMHDYNLYMQSTQGYNPEMQSTRAFNPYVSYNPQQQYFNMLGEQSTEIKKLKEYIEALKIDFEKLKTVSELTIKDAIVSNSFIDSTIEKFKTQDELNTETDNNLKNYDNRLNTAFKKIEKINNKLKNLDKQDKEQEENPNEKSITIIKRGPETSINSILSHIFSSMTNSDQESIPKNDLLDSDDEFEDIDLYVTPKIEELEKDINIIDTNIKTLEDLIAIGKKYEMKNKTIKKPPKTQYIYENKSNNSLFGQPFSTQQSGTLSSISPMPSMMVLPTNKTPYLSIPPIQSKPSLDFKKSETNNFIGDKQEKYYTYDGKKYNIDIEKIVNLIEPLTKLLNTIGMSKIKEQILEMILYYIQGFEKTTSDMLHTSIEGPPGVGKTKLGRILAQIYHGLGVISSKRFKRVRRTDLIGKYLGHTAHKTQEVIDEAEGGVLFIDEAYSLGNGEDKDSFSKECIDTINMNLTEKKKNLIVIVAGYSDQLDKSFFAMNEGLRRRFPFRFTIDGYDYKELTQIFYTKIKKLKWKLDKDLSQEYLEDFFKKNKEHMKHYGGDIETIVMNCKMTHAKRVIGKPHYYKKIITIDDFDKAYDNFKNNKIKKEEISDSIKHIYM